VQVGRLDPGDLPVAGVAEVRKMADRMLPSDALVPNSATSDGKPI
jgi:carboxymethylenebutenolidase